MDPQRNNFKNKPLEHGKLVLFFVLAYAWSWFWWALFIFGVLELPAGVGTPDVDLSTVGLSFLALLVSPFGPTVAAFLLTGYFEGRAEIKMLWKRFWNLRLNWKWLLALSLFYPLVWLITRYSAQYLTGTLQPPCEMMRQPWLILAAFLPSILHGGLSEEFGWRGYALTRLQSRFPAVAAALFLGVLEGCWHIPLLWMPDDVRAGLTIPELIFPYLAVGIFRAWIYNNTNGNVQASVLFHAWGNTVSWFIPFSVPTIWFFYGIETAVAVLLVLFFGARNLTRFPWVIRKRPVTKPVSPTVDV